MTFCCMMSSNVKSNRFCIQFSAHWSTRLKTDQESCATEIPLQDPHSPPLQSGDGFGCHGDALDGALVASAADSEVAVLAPAGAPAVLHNPELLPGLVAAAESHQQHGVVGQLEGIEAVCEAGVVVDALLVVHEVRVHLREKPQFTT